MDVDRRLLIVTRSETSDDAIEKFDGDIRALQRLDVAKGYVELIAEVEHLRCKQLLDWVISGTDSEQVRKHGAISNLLHKLHCNHTFDFRSLLLR